MSLTSPLRRVARIAPILALSLLAACGWLRKEEEDNTTPVDKLYAEAKEDALAGNYERAVKSLERVEARAAGTLLAQQAQLDLAYAQWRSGEKVLALAALDRFTKLNPSSPAMDYALYLRGRINFNDNLGVFGNLSGQKLSERDQQATRDSYQTFRQLVEQFPNSPYAEDARVRMDYIVNALAEYEVHVARYYLRRGAWLAAANRAQQAVQGYPQAPANEEALYIMSAAYQRLGLEQLSNDARRVLATNFPTSPYLNEGAAASKSWWKLW